jgi:hypothetical protein
MRLVVSVSSRRLGFGSRPVYVGFVVDRVSLGQTFSEYLCCTQWLLTHHIPRNSFLRVVLRLPTLTLLPSPLAHPLLCICHIFLPLSLSSEEYDRILRVIRTSQPNTVPNYRSNIYTLSLILIKVIVLVHPMKSYRGSGGIAPCILNLGTI